MSIKHNTYFYPQRKSGHRFCNLMMRVSWNHLVASFGLGYPIDTERWDYDEQRCRIRSFHGKKKTPSQTINNEIDRYATIVENIFSDFERIGRTPSKNEFREYVSAQLIGKNPHKDDTTMDELFVKFIDTERLTSSWTDGTVKKMNTLKRHLHESFPGMMVKDISKDTFRAFVDWHIRNGFSNNTIQKNLATFRWFVRWLYRNDYYDGKAVEQSHIKLKTYDRPVLFLTWDELMKVYHLELSDRNEEIARDGLCLSCFTGLRYSDLIKLKKHDISCDVIKVVTQKTTDILYIDLNRWSRAILNKYADWDDGEDHAVPVFCNQVMNKILKRVGAKAGLDELITLVSYKGSTRIENTYHKWQLLTTHCGRRTFVVNAMALGVPESVIMSWTGHHDSKAMKPYKKVLDKVKRSMMDRFDALQDQTPGNITTK